jgi:hypothetical protein
MRSARQLSDPRDRPRLSDNRLSRFNLQHKRGDFFANATECVKVMPPAHDERMGGEFAN